MCAKMTLMRAGSSRGKGRLSSTHGLASNGRGAHGRGANGRTAPKQGAAARYEVQERVGESTLFVVYRVRDKQSGSVHALKALKGAFNRHPGFASTLKDAALRVQTLSHSNLARMDEVDEEEGTLFLVTEWLPGQTLESRLRRAPFGRTEVTLCARQIAAGLQALHENNLAHGDLRPRQIGAAADGTLKISDIGFYGAFAQAGLAPMDVLEDAVYYSAPERSDGAPPTPAADLYALGVILYRMLAGRMPFEGPTPLAIAMRHRNDVPLRPSQFNPECPADLEALAMRLLEKNAALRPTSADEVLAELGGTPRPRVAAPAVPPAPDPAATEPLPSADTPAAPLVSTQVAGVAAVAGAVAGTSVSSASAASASTAAASVVAPAVAVPVAPVTAPAPAPVTLPAPTTAAAPAATPATVTAPAPVTTDPVAVVDDALERRKHRRREALGALYAFFWLLASIGIFVGIIWGAYKFWEDQKPPEVKVPAYVGKSDRQARAMLQKYGLKMVVVTLVYDPRKPAGTVLKGQPEPGKKVRWGREVGVTVSRGPEPTIMPDLAELDIKNAQRILEKAGLRIGNIASQFHDSIPRGYICGQYPEAGQSFRPNDPITLVVSLGSQPTGNTTPAPLPAPRRRQPTAPDNSLPSPVITQQETPQTPSDVPLVSRTVQVRVAIPSDGKNEEVRIVVRDSGGETTVYQQTHAPGDLVEQDIPVMRAQGATASVRVYVGNVLVRDQRV
jgi:eukaryotic-like serine/threonine-protein kinase